MQETTRQTAVEAVNKHDFLFLIAGTRGEDGSYDTRRIIEGKIGELAIPLADALKDNSSLENYVLKIRMQEKIPEILHGLADALSEGLVEKNSKQKEKGETENE